MRAYEPITTKTLHDVARDMGIRIEGDAQSFVLRPVSGSDDWRAVSTSGRRKNAITWEGHYVFLERVLSIWPEGRIKSSLADYQGLRDFKAKAPATAY